MSIFTKSSAPIHEYHGRKGLILLDSLLDKTDLEWRFEDIDMYEAKLLDNQRVSIIKTEFGESDYIIAVQEEDNIVDRVCTDDFPDKQNYRYWEPCVKEIEDKFVELYNRAMELSMERSKAND